MRSHDFSYYSGLHFLALPKPVICIIFATRWRFKSLLRQPGNASDLFPRKWLLAFFSYRRGLLTALRSLILAIAPLTGLAALR